MILFSLYFGDNKEKQHPKAMRWHPLKAYIWLMKQFVNPTAIAYHLKGHYGTTHIAFNLVLVSVIKLMVNFVQLLS